jgi:hypothetical protein
VVGVRTSDGAPVEADGVVIAGGRGLPLAAWLAAIGAQAPQEIAEECGVIYYTRYFRLLSGDGTPLAMEPLMIGGDLGYMGYGMMGSDRGTFHVLLTPAATDTALRVLREDWAFMAVLHSVPALASWVAPERAAPIGPVEAMGRLNNMLRRFVVAGRPLATGLFVIGDARCHTNPAYGWGASLAMAQAFTLAGVVAEHPDDLLAQALDFEARVEHDLACWHHIAVSADRERTQRFQSAAGLALPQAPPALGGDDPEHVIHTLVKPAMAEDPDLFRAYTRRWHLLDPPDALPQNAALLERARALAEVRQQPAEPAERLGPTREEAFALIAAARPGTAAQPPTATRLA